MTTNANNTKRALPKIFTHSGALAHGILMALAPLGRFKISIAIYHRLEMFFAALAGRGAGSGWNSIGQTKALARLAPQRPGKVVVDVGANNGEWSKELYGFLKDEDAHFHMFECAPYCFAPLERYTGDMPHRTVVKKAVSDHEGTAQLHMPKLDEGGSGLASLHERNDTSVRHHDYETLNVETITLDRYAAEAGLDQIDILKIDVEGHEMAVLKGAERLLAEGRIATIMFETGSANVNSRTFFRDFWELFTQHGYAIHRILYGGVTLHIDAYDDADEYFRGCSNFIAVKS